MMTLQESVVVPPQGPPTITTFAAFNDEFRQVMQRIRNAMENARRLR